MGSAPNVPASNEAIVATYDRLAAPYDRLIAPLQAVTRRRAIERLDLDAGERVLELGCGPGHALPALAGDTAPDGHVIGLDAAPGMLERARRRVGRSAPTAPSERADGSPSASRRSARDSRRGSSASPIDLLLGDARSLPVRDGVVDAVFVEDTLELFTRDEIETVLAECARVLEADGRLCVVTMDRTGIESEPFLRAYEWLFEHLPGYDRVGCRPIYARRALEAGGFEVDRHDRHRRASVWPVDVLLARPG